MHSASVLVDTEHQPTSNIKKWISERQLMGVWNSIHSRHRCSIISYAYMSRWRIQRGHRLNCCQGRRSCSHHRTWLLGRRKPVSYSAQAALALASLSNLKMQHFLARGVTACAQQRFEWKTKYWIFIAPHVLNLKNTLKVTRCLLPFVSLFVSRHNLIKSLTCLREMFVDIGCARGE